MLTSFATTWLRRVLVPLAGAPLLIAALAMTNAPSEAPEPWSAPVRVVVQADTIPAVPVSGGVSPAALEAAGVSMAPIRRTALSFSLDRLMIPVAGITRDDLMDTFTARRSGGRTHRAIDIVAPSGTPIVAISDGRIVRKHTNRLGGKVLYLRSPDGRYAFYYAHLRDYATGIEQGATVLQGDTLGYVGNTGNARHTVPHLHFQVIEAGNRSDRRLFGGQKLNPYPLLRRSQLHRSDDGRVRG